MFCKHSAQEFMDFTSRILVEKTDEGQRTSVGEKGSLSIQLLLQFYCHDDSSRWEVILQ